MWDDRTTRRPRKLTRLPGSLWLRDDARALIWLLFQDPPRTTRRFVTGSPTGRNRHDGLWHRHLHDRKKIVCSAQRALHCR